MIVLMKPRILIVENSTAITGAFKSVLRSCIALGDEFDFHFLFPAGSSCRRIVEENGFPVAELPMKELSKRPLSWILYIPFLLMNVIKLSGIQKKIRANLIHVNDFYNLVPCLYRALGGSVPYVCHVRFMPSRFPPALMKAIFSLHVRYAEKIIAVSNAVIRELPRNDKVILLHDGLPVSENQSGFSYDPRCRIILYLSNYIKGKGQEYALTAFSKIHTRYPDWQLRFVGGDLGLEKNREFKRSLQQMAVDLNLDHQIKWDNFVTEVTPVYEEAALVLNFSDSESFSITCLEAMYSGRPVIATSSGGPSEIIEQGISGLLVPVADVEAMGKAMESLLSSPVLRSEIASRAYASVREKFDIARLSGRLKGVYLPLVPKYSSN